MGILVAGDVKASTPHWPQVQNFGLGLEHFVNLVLKIVPFNVK